MEQFLREMHPDYYNFAEEVAMLAEIITDYVSLVLVFDMEEDSDLDGYMISSLLASGETGFLCFFVLSKMKVTLDYAIFNCVYLFFQALLNISIDNGVWEIWQQLVTRDPTNVTLK